MDITPTSTPLLGIDIVPVERWLAQHAPGLPPPYRFERITGGHSNLTYRVTARNGSLGVLRRPPVGKLLATAHNLIREHDVMFALAGSRVPVPRMIGACRDDTVTGAPFYFMDHIVGLVVNSEADADGMLPSPHARRHAAEALVESLVALHEVDIDQVGLGGLARRGGYLGRQLRRWTTQWEATRLGDLGGMHALQSWLVEHQPAETPSRLVHGDYRLGNTLIDADGQVLAVLDWELCTLGDPLLDLAYFVRAWTEPDARPGFERPFGVLPGFPTGDELVELYARQSGRSMVAFGYWRAFTAWRSAAILGGVYRRYLDGQMGEPPERLDAYRVEVESRILQGLSAASAR